MNETFIVNVKPLNFFNTYFRCFVFLLLDVYFFLLAISDFNSHKGFLIKYEPVWKLILDSIYR